MLINTILKADLFLFDGGAASAGTASAGATDSTGAATQNSEGETFGDDVIPWDLVGGKPEGFGENEGNTEPSQGAVAPTEKVADNSQSDIDSYEKAKERYRDEYEKDIQRHIDRRFKTANKEIKNLTDELGSLKQLRDMVARKYPGVDVNDTQALLNAVQGDDSYLRQRAIDNGTTVEEERAQLERDREMDSLRQRVAKMDEANEQRETAAELNRQSLELQKVYPNFDLQEALQDDTFCECLAFSKSAKGVEDVKLAYEIAFKDRILQSAVQQTVDSTKVAVAENLRANQYMPPQAGRNNTSVANSNNAQKFTTEELAQMAYDGVDISKYLD